MPWPAGRRAWFAGQGGRVRRLNDPERTQEYMLGELGWSDFGNTTPAPSVILQRSESNPWHFAIS